MSLTTVEGENGDQQVFRPVPTDEDLRAMKAEMDSVRRSRRGLAVTVVFLAGVLLAAGVGLAMMYTFMSGQIAEARDEAKTAAALVAGRDETIAANEQTISQQQAVIDSYADLQSIQALRDQASSLEAEIAALLSEPSRANAPQSLRALPDDVDWLDGVVTDLRARRDALQIHKDAVAAWPPPAANPRPD